MPTPSPIPPARAPLHARLREAPISSAEVEARARQALRPALRVALVLVPVLLLAGLAYAAFDLWSQMPPTLAPRHRAEGVCFALAAPDPVTGARFQPPMRIEPSAALVHDRFAPQTPPAVALRDVMHLEDGMVIREWQRHVGDFDVSGMWLRLPAGSGEAGGSEARHWLVLCWMEDGNLAVANFRFAGGDRELSADERQWGQRLMQRVLTPQNFRAGVLPAVRLRLGRGATMPTFGPPPRS